jgi:hypothetical protein
MPKLSVGIPVFNGQELFASPARQPVAAAAIKVPATTPQAVVQAMARHIDSLASDRARLRQTSQAGYRFATTQQWKDRALLMEQLYRQALARRGVNQTSS